MFTAFCCMAGPVVHQAVIRIYLLVATGVLAAVFAVWPKIGPRNFGFGLIRAGVVVAGGLGVLLNAFHSAGRIDEVRVVSGRVFIQETFPERAWGEVVWTSLVLKDGSFAPAEDRALPTTISTRSRAKIKMRLVPHLRGRAERPVADGHFEAVGPELLQGVEAYGERDWIIVSAFDELSDPSSVYLARIQSNGEETWRLDAKTLGLKEGRLRRSVRIPEGPLIVVMTGRRFPERTFDRLTFASHVVVVSIEVQSGKVLWRAAF